MAITISYHKLRRWYDTFVLTGDHLYGDERAKTINRAQNAQPS